ncbi:hypothetical protein [Lacticaseibacillus nasuensis]|uniref:Uncharacterized protein n=1 Tax=Lacticaseibacillus nasuensis JCM 17158 TaxID=1291734 RepID=A0A0R1JNX6_9LACO|nr:hypothetical protein [Lacticaseibacillus nasuensis]KRK72888.1 hypothetical protein FD02_GL001306 [Lacticaseibacillus nasuensis JCM 17158]MCX2455094.1 hypothetical protein [Lacticaseibacillus nasuensis]
MIQESRTLIENFDRLFKRQYGWRYKILIVDNHFYHCYSFFIDYYKHGQKLHYSDDLLEIPHDPVLYRRVLADLKAHTNLSIEYRDTHHLVHPGTDITFDASHGHAFSTSYRPED